MRLNRFLALTGLASRRKCEELIRESRIEINGTTVENLSTQVDPERDRVTYDGERLRIPDTFFYLMMHKPSGFVVSTSDERGRATVYELLPGPVRGKVQAVGRLDRGSEGLLLFTNDGVLANALLHPRHGVERLYVAWVAPPPRMEDIARLRAGVPLEQGERSGPAQVRVLGRKKSTARVRIALREGKNREVRRMFRAVGCRVLALRRVAFGGLALNDLPTGKTRNLTRTEIAMLKQAAGIEKEV